jgi:hypothetical protein
MNIVRKRVLGHLILGFVSMGLSGLFTPAFAVEPFTVDQNVVVACKKADVHPQADAFTVSAKMLKYGTRLKIIELAKLYELPDSDPRSKKSLEEESDEDTLPVFESDYTRAAWVKFEKGYVATSCLVTEELFKEENIEAAEKKINKIVASKGKRNFSEGESGDMTAMRGAAGKAKGGPARYNLIDKYIRASANTFDGLALTLFRNEGSLGESK